MTTFFSKDNLRLYEDESILAVNKPATWETIIEKGGKLCFTTLIRQIFENDELAPVHRLDRETSGVLIFAKTKKALDFFIMAFREHSIQKEYIGFCAGLPRDAMGVVKRNLTLWKGGHKPVQITNQGGMVAETKFKLMEKYDKEGKKFSQILFHPKEGRTHQIRVHAAYLGSPILGDNQYGNRQINRQVKEWCGLNRQALHASQMTFLNEGKQEIKIFAPLASELIDLTLTFSR